MTPEEIEAKVKALICEQLEVTEDQVTIDASFVDDLQADSLALVELVLALEQEFGEFGLEIPDEETEKMRTVRDAVAYVKSVVG